MKKNHYHNKGLVIYKVKFSKKCQRNYSMKRFTFSEVHAIVAFSKGVIC